MYYRLRKITWGKLLLLVFYVLMKKILTFGFFTWIQTNFFLPKYLPESQILFINLSEKLKLVILAKSSANPAPHIMDSIKLSIVAILSLNKLKKKKKRHIQNCKKTVTINILSLFIWIDGAFTCSRNFFV